MVVFATGAGASSSSDHGFNEQLASRADSAITLSLRLIFEQLFAGNMIDVCSIIVIRACPMASVAIICLVAAVQAAKRVTIPAQNRRWRPIIHAALSAILFNKVKHLGHFNRNLRENGVGFIMLQRNDIASLAGPLATKKVWQN